MIMIMMVNQLVSNKDSLVRAEVDSTRCGITLLGAFYFFVFLYQWKGQHLPSPITQTNGGGRSRRAFTGMTPAPSSPPLQ